MLIVVVLGDRIGAVGVSSPRFAQEGGNPTSSVREKRRESFLSKCWLSAWHDSRLFSPGPVELGDDIACVVTCSVLAFLV